MKTYHLSTTNTTPIIIQHIFRWALLPLMLLTWSLTASAQRITNAGNSKKVVLNWNAATENDYSHFIIERSLDNVEFSEVGLMFTGEEQLSNGNMAYSFSDDVKKVRKGVLYYRISMVDMKGKKTKTAVQMVNTSEQKDQPPVINIAAVPETKALRVTLPLAWVDKYVSIELINKAGEVVRQSFNKETTNRTETISVKDLTAGLYAVKVSNGSETIIHHIVTTN